jgi:dynein heavy chain
MATLKFKQNDEGEDIKEAVGMYSKEKEYVNFDKICDCHGQVKIRCRFFAYTGKT